MKIKLKTQWNYKPEVGEINSGEKLLCPDEAYSIEEILLKFTRGIALDVVRDGYYSDTDDFEDVDPFSGMSDLSDIAEVQERIDERARRKASKGSQGAKAVKPAEPTNATGEPSDV